MLQSRVADSLYWIARYLERAGHTIRLIDVRLDLELDRPAGADGWDFARLCTAVRCDVSAGAPLNPGELIDALVFDGGNSGSVRSSASRVAWPGRTGASASEQLPMMTEVAP